jgi:hypothetical protein
VGTKKEPGSNEKDRLLKLGIRAAAFVACALIIGASAPAGATGTVNITQHDGSHQTYPDVGIQIVSKRLELISADKKGKLHIDRAACSKVGELLRCLPTSATLTQGGSTKPLDALTGTIYLNFTDAAVPLSLSSTKVPAHSVLLTILTQRGTYINAAGTIDGGTK